jgi:cellulose synthase/poly-beta-1,6-N-acetylglucosamine synthase-like glycosyltransferase
MSPAEIVACTSLAILFYCYAGYGIMVWLLTLPGRKVKGNGPVTDDRLPPLTLVIPAYNEKDILPAKIANCLSLDYPRALLHLVFVTDGSTDGSEILLHQYPQVTILHQPQRQGKYAALKRAMTQVTTPVVVFSDCNAMLNVTALKLLARHLDDPRTGAVAGEKTVQTGGHSTVGRAEGLYWKYESFMKKRDAQLYTVVGAAGELFALRTSLFRHIDRDVILDDFFISISACLRGFRIAYEPGAFAAEPASASLAEEAKRKVRIAAGACQALGLLPQCLNIFKYPLLSFQYLSRRVLRWLFCPLLLVVLFISSFYSVLTNATAFSFWLVTAQFLFYAGAFAGWVMVKQGKPAGLLTIPFYFVFMNTCMLRGFGRFLSGKQSVLWERSVREVIS